MATLTEPQKRRILEELACFKRPSEVVEVIKEEFGIEIDRRQVSNYDVSKPRVQAKGPKPEYQELFWATRQKFLDKIEGIAIANQAVRLERLEAIFHEEHSQRNFGAAKETLKQAAKEVGGMFTSKRHLDVTSDDEPIQGVFFQLPGTTSRTAESG